MDEEKKLDPNAKESSSLISKHFQKLSKDLAKETITFLCKICKKEAAPQDLKK